MLPNDSRPVKSGDAIAALKHLGDPADGLERSAATRAQVDSGATGADELFVAVYTIGKVRETDVNPIGQLFISNREIPLERVIVAGAKK
jgi:hypothetical protein